MAASVPEEMMVWAPVGAVPPLGVVIASSCGTSSAADCHRSAARFSRQRITSPLSWGEMVGR
jgi:hypothetical protein